MKSIYLMLGSMLVGFQLLAQTSYSTLTIQLRGDQNRSIMIDSRDYTPSGYNAMNNATITVNNLTAGQHLLEVNRSRNRYGSADVSVTFSLRNDYDKTIIVEEDGSLHQTETRRVGNNNSYDNNYGSYNNYYGYRPQPMSSSTFSSLYRATRSRWGTRARMNLLDSYFDNDSYYFTTAQVEQLIRLVPNENGRLKLAEDALDHVIDAENYSQLNDMFSRRSSIVELETYASSHRYFRDGDNDRRGDHDRRDDRYGNGRVNDYPYHQAVTDYEFDRTYQEINMTFGIGAKMSSLQQLFLRTGNYYTVDQVEKLIRLVSDQDNRLQLAKLAYSHIVDPQNIATMYDVFDRQSTIDEFKISVGIR